MPPQLKDTPINQPTHQPTYQRAILPVAIVLERPERHGFSLRNDGGYHSITVSVWIMEMVAATESEDEVMDRCLDRVKRLYTILVGHCDDEQLRGWRVVNCFHLSYLCSLKTAIDGHKADLKRTKSANNIVGYAKHATRKQGAEKVVFQFDNYKPKIKAAIKEMQDAGIHGYYFVTGSKEVKTF